MTSAIGDVIVTGTISSSRSLDIRNVGASIQAGVTITGGRVLGEGAFGRVAEVERIGHHLVNAIVVKVHSEAPGTDPATCAAHLRDLHAAIVAAGFVASDRVPDLLPGVPFWVGTGRLAGKVVHISLANNMASQGYRPLDEILEQPSLRGSWLKAPVALRISAALNLAQGLALLERLRFLHGDINTENVFLNMSAGRAALIDFDAGAVMPKSPMTCGKFDEFSAFEIQALRTPQAAIKAYDSRAERWSIGVTLHFLMFGLGPLFFLRAQTPEVLGDYLRSFSWPDLKPGYQYVNSHNLPFHPIYMQELADLPASVLDQFRAFLVDGATDPSRRPSAAEWTSALVSFTRPPVVSHLAISKVSVVEGEPVEISWTVENATSVWLDGDGPFGASGRLERYPTRTRPASLLAKNAFGEVSAKTALIRVYPVPRILTLAAPSPAVPAMHVAVTVPRAPVVGATRATDSAGLADALGHVVGSDRPSASPQAHVVRSPFSASTPRLDQVSTRSRLLTLRFPSLRLTKCVFDEPVTSKQ